MRSSPACPAWAEADALAAAAKARAPETFWVPGRSPRSCPPPWRRGFRRTPDLRNRAPTPTGPPTLWAVTESASTASASSGTRVNAWTASVWKSAPTACAQAASSRTGWTMPVSLFAVMMETSATRRSRSGSSAAGSMKPSRVGITVRTSKPRFLSSGAQVSTASCSIAEMTTTSRALSFIRAASARPKTARLSLSVPPEVKSTSAGRTERPMVRARFLRAPSSARAASRPGVWSELGFAPA